MRVPAVLAARPGLALAGLTLVALVLRVAAGVVTGGFGAPATPWERGYEIGAVADALVRGEGFADPYRADTGPTANVGPVPPLLLAGLDLVLGRGSLAAWRLYLLANCVFSALVVPALFVLARRAGGSIAGWAAAAAWCVHPVAVLGAVGWPHSAHLFALAVTIVVDRLLALEHVVAGRGVTGDAVAGDSLGRPVLAAALAFGASLWIEPLLLPVVLAWIVLALLRRRPRVAFAGALVLAGGLLIVAPWMVRHWSALGEPVFLRSRAGPELLLGAAAGPGEPTPIHLDPTRNPEEMRALRELGEARWAAEKRDEALVLVREAPARWSAAVAWRYAVFWIGRLAWWAPAEGHPLLAGPLTAARGLVHLLPAALAVAGLLLGRRRSPVAVAVLGAVLLAYPVTYALTHVEARYRLPVEPVVLAAAALLLAGRSVAPARGEAGEGRRKGGGEAAGGQRGGR